MKDLNHKDFDTKKEAMKKGKHSSYTTKSYCDQYNWQRCLICVSLRFEVT